MPLRVVFMGTPDYAVPSLRALLEAGYDVAALFTQPDRPRGRGGKPAAPAAKLFALERGVPVRQVEKIRKDGVEELKRLCPDLCVTAAFGQILSQELLDIPRLGTVNVHASLLPRYRGSSPVHWCLINGETRTGVTTMMTDRGIDTGDILLQEATDILPEETAGELTGRLAILGADLLLRTLALLAEGRCPRRKQEEAQASWHPMLTKEMGLIRWDRDANSIVCLVRGLNPWPCAQALLPCGPIKVLAAREAQGFPALEAGTVLSADGRQGLVVAAGEGAVRIVKLKGEGGREMHAEDYLRGHPLPAGCRLPSGA